MSFRGKLRLEVQPPPVPTSEIVQRWQRAGFEPAACRAALEAIIAEHSLPASYFDLSQIERGGFVATDELVFGFFANPRTYSLTISSRERSFGLETDESGLPDMFGVVRVVLDCDDFAAAREQLEGLDEEALAIIADAYAVASPPETWPAIGQPGVYRREHASLVIQTEQATLVTDPQGFVAAWTTDNGAYPGDPTPRPQARVLLTHTHDDHFSIPSILSWCDEDTPVVVPRVARPSLLAEDVAGLLRAGEQACESPAWHSRFREGDVEIEVLPFYGEQPTRVLPMRDRDARNWGNCYRFDLGDYSLAILVDSGVDPTGSMIEALGRSVAEHGPIDILMSCCVEFPEAVNPGLPEYCLMVPFAALRELAAQRASMTLGPRGIAEACAVTGARYFLPYAHGFAGLGRMPISLEGAMGEPELLAQIEDVLSARGATTRVVPWNPGDRMRWSEGEVVVDQI